MKIMLIGYSGSGKSTLARILGKQYGAEVLHLDAVQFTAGWSVRPRSEQQEILEEFMNQHESWIIDGNYSWNHYERRLKESDRILLMLFPRLLSLCRVVKRYFAFRGKTRPDMAEGCTEKLDAEFIRWILWEGRRPEIRQRYREIQTRYPQKCTVLRSQREIDRLLRSTKEMTY